MKRHQKRRIRSAAATGVFLLLLAATFFTYWQKASGSSLRAYPASYSTAHSGSGSTTQSAPDELQRALMRYGPALADDELQRALARYGNAGQ